MIKTRVLSGIIIALLILSTSITALQPVLANGSVIGTTQMQVRQNSVNTMLDPQNVSRLSIPFIENEGQAGNEIRFYANTFGNTIFVTNDGLTYSFYKDKDHDSELTIKERFLGELSLSPVGIEKSKPSIKYLAGDSLNWHDGGIVSYNTLEIHPWQSIDLRVYAYGNNIEKIFYVNPQGHVGDIKVAVDGVRSLGISSEGSLIMQTQLGTIVMSKPQAYQNIGDNRIPIDISYTVEGTAYGFVVGTYNPLYTLVIDPAISSTFVGGSDEDIANAIAVDSDGNIYVTGQTLSHDFPSTRGAFSATPFGGYDVFISKFNRNFSLLASTYIGGSKYDYSNAIAVDSSGNIYITGQTSSPDFPTTSGTYKRTLVGSENVFVTKFDKNFGLVASTLIGGNGHDYSNAIAVDSSGNIYITGHSSSSDFPITSGSYMTKFTGGSKVFVAKFNNNLSTLLRSTLIGGSYYDYAYAMALDPIGNIYITGQTFSSDFPTTSGAYKETSSRGGVFVSELDNNLSLLEASTYVSGSSNGVITQMKTDDSFGILQADVSRAIKIDSTGNIYITGQTFSSDFPTTSGAYKKALAGTGHVFISKLNHDLSSLSASTLIGGSSYDSATGLALDASGNVYISGYTLSTDFPTTPGAYKRAFTGVMFDSFVSKFNSDLSTLVGSTYRGWSGDNFANAITWGSSSGNIYITGQTSSFGFPTTSGPSKTAPAEGIHPFVSEFPSNLS